MAALTDPARTRALLEKQLRGIARLRGTGPNPFEYGLWDSRSKELIADVYGPDSPEFARYLEAAGIRGRLPGVRGSADNMTLNIHGQWGIRGRLERAETVIRDLIAELPPAPNTEPASPSHED